MDGPGRDCAEWSMSDIERKMQYDFAYMWNLKNRVSEQTKQKQTH